MHLKNDGRIEALFTRYLLPLLTQALIERELRTAMAQHDIEQLPLYPEQRLCRRPTTEQILRLFNLAQRHWLVYDGQRIQLFDAHLTELQLKVLSLLAVPKSAYVART